MTPHTPGDTPSPHPDYPRIWSISHSEAILSSTEVEKGGFWVRSIAYLIDKTILSIIGLIFFSASLIAQKTSFSFQNGIPAFKNFFMTLVLTYFAGLIIEVAYFTFFYGYSGQTIGKMVCGLKVVSSKGELISYRRAFLRWIGYQISFYIFFLGFFWIAVDPKKQGWHDKIAKTFVIKT